MMDLDRFYYEVNELPVEISMPDGELMDQPRFDLEERTAKFGEAVIDSTNVLPYDRVIDVLVKQIVRSATSIGANYMEADCSCTKKDFNYKINLCRKEAKETKHWLRMIAKANPSSKDGGRKLWQEAHELTLIFSSIVSSKHNLKLAIIIHLIFGLWILGF